MKDAPNEDPRTTWRMASYLPPERRKTRPEPERRADARRAALGERRQSNRRTLLSLLRF